MATENINIVVNESGTDEVIARLQQLGLTAEEATSRVSSGYRNMSQAATFAANSEKIVAAAAAQGVKDLTAFREALDRMTTAEVSAAASSKNLAVTVAALAKEFGTVGGAARLSAAEVVASAEAVAGASKSFSGLTAALVAFVGIEAAFHASDEYTNLSNQLKLVTKDSAEFTQVYGKLLQTANASGTSLDTIAGLFARFRTTAEGAKIPVEELERAIQNLAIGLKQSGSTTDETNRIIKDLAEAFAKGEIGGRQLLSILQQNSTFAKLLGNAMGTDLSQALHTASDRTDGLKAHLAELGNEARGVHGSADGLSDSIKRQTREADDLNKKFLEGKIKYDAFSDASRKLSRSLEEERGKLAQLGPIQAQKIAADEKATRSALAAAEAEESLTAGSILKGLLGLKVGTDGLTASTITFSGIANVAKNNFEDLFKEGTVSNGIMTVLKATLLGLAQNVGTVTFGLGLLAAGFVALKIAEAITGYQKLTVAIRETAIAQRLLNSAMSSNLIGLAITTILTIVAYFADWKSAIDQVKAAFNQVIEIISPIFNGILQDLGLVSNGTLNLGQVFQDTCTNVVVLSLKAVIYTIGALIVGVLNIIKTFTDFGRAAGDAIAGTKTEVGGLAGALGTLVGDAISGFNHVKDAILSVENAIADIIAAVDRAITAFKDLFKLQGGGGDADGAGAQRAAGTGHARDGAYFVHGGTGTDTVPFLVSPGERIIVQTRQQQVNNVIPMHGPSFGRFRDGGGTLVSDLGTGVGLKYTDNNGAPTSVTGFTPEALKAANDNLSTATKDNTAATQANTDALTSTQAVGNPNIIGPAPPNGSIVAASDASGGSSGGSSLSGGSTSTSSDKYQLGGAISQFGTNGAAQQYSASDANSSNAIESGSSTWTASKIGAVVNGVFMPQSYSKKNADGTTSLKGAVYRDGGDMYARNGLDHYVNGGTGTDTKRVNLAVSPGESIHVRTPQQRLNADQPVSRNQTTVLHVHTPDANSFRHSRQQVAGALYRASRRNNRKFSSV